MRKHPLSIAILGTRGIPASYGGFETFAEQLSVRLAERGHLVTVYCRTRGLSSAASYKGVRLVHLPAVRTKSAETLSHTLLSALHSLFHHYDVVYVCNSANAPICYIPRLAGRTVILNVDGLEWRRRKWGSFAKRYYRWATRLAASMPIEIVTDAATVERYYLQKFQRETRVFGYGTDSYDRGYLAGRLAQFDLRPDGYFLYVSRLEPENNPDLAIRAYADVATQVPLVVVGDAPYGREYVEQLHQMADPRVKFLGYRFGDDYHALQSNALAYIQASEVGGTHPALVEAMGHGNVVFAHDVPEHREVLGDAGAYFGFHEAKSLTDLMSGVLHLPEWARELRRRAADRVASLYSWDAITDGYEAYFRELMNAPGDRQQEERCR
jgi:glycosyltransferase involved in cell wall biosynthesis